MIISEAFNQLMAIEEKKRDRLQQAENEYSQISADLATAQQRYSELAAEDDPGTDEALKVVKQLEGKLQDAQRKKEAIRDGRASISENQKNLAGQFLEEAQAVNHEAQAAKEKIIREVEEARSVYIEKLEEYLQQQARQVELRRQLDKVFGNYPGACLYGQDYFNSRPKLDITPLYKLPLVTAEDINSL